MSEKLYTTQEVAKILRVSERSVFRYIDDNKLKATKIGYWRISESDLIKFLRENANVPHQFTFGAIRLHLFNGNITTGEPFSKKKKSNPKAKKRKKLTKNKKDE